MNELGINCELATYLDNDYICTISGNRCNITPIPNCDDCIEYEKNKENK